ncbi:hypothetical protein [Flavobacterium sp.]|uniref:hypothetical protein n=1 Tax=Flavobacterium sp. TaxID=239 RepID=UPI002BE96C76|nr:hypothetical protein [Flavobacterium sp.]HSD06778.1 hypothetical protein [Flavobacterium sp.]
MAKSPVNNPPIAQVETEGASVPSLAVEKIESSSSISSDEAAPTLTPPSAINYAAEDGFGAGVWNNDKRINALFSVNETRNSWISVVGIGWVKLANTIDSANEALTVFSTAGKVKNSPVNYFLDGGQVTQIYVW